MVPPPVAEAPKPVEPAPEPVEEVKMEPVAESIPEVKPEPVAEAPKAEEPAPEPVAEEKPAEPAPAPVVEEPKAEEPAPAPEPVVEEKPVESAPEPVAEEKPAEPAPEPVVEAPKAEEPAPEPVAEEKPTEPAPEPVAEVSEPEPVAEEPQEVPEEPQPAAEEPQEGVPESIYFRCPQCNQEIEAPGNAVGAEAECPLCGAIVIIPAYNQDGTIEKSEVVSVQEAEKMEPEVLKHRTIRIDAAELGLDDLQGGNDAQSQMITFVCDACQQEIEATADMAGSQAECPNCGAIIMVTMSSQGEDEEMTPEMKNRTMRIDINNF